MAWTWPTALFFVGIALMLALMTMLELWRPTVRRRGFLPMATTRGDRLFLSLLTIAFIHLGWLAAVDAPLWMASLFSVVVLVLLLRYG